MKELFYHSPFEGNKKPRVTICGVIREDNVFVNVYLSIGIARCSEKDNFNKKKGRTIAKGRAYKNSIVTSSYSNEREAEKAFYDLAITLSTEILIHPNYV